VIRLVDVYRGGKVALGAVEFLYELLQERPPEANISHAEMPTIEHHRGFVVRRPYRHWYIIENAEGERVGAIYATETNAVGIAVLRAHQRHGYAMRALRLFLQTHQPAETIRSVRPGRFVANVAPGNAVSREMFEKLGGRIIQVTYELP
jgi:RimJ/RimL family protein N-acetyltransferase